MARIAIAFIFAAFFVLLKATDELNDFEFSDSEEVMVAQESKTYNNVVRPPKRIITPMGLTNSHRPQYLYESYEVHSQEAKDFEDQGSTLRKNPVVKEKFGKVNLKENLIKEAVLRAWERKDHVGKFAQVAPIIRAMSGNQRVALASLVANQVSTPPGRTPLNLVQVRSMFGNSDNTTELMLPILLDMANLIRRAVRSGKEPREVKLPYQPAQLQMLRRSDTGDIELDDEPFDMGIEHTTVDSRRIPQRKHTNKTDNKNIQNTSTRRDINNNIDTKNNTSSSLMSEPTEMTMISMESYENTSENGTIDLTADSSNQTLAQDLPVAEKLRGHSRYNHLNAGYFRRPNYQPKKPSTLLRRTTPEPTVTPQPVRRRTTKPTPLAPSKRKIPMSQIDLNKCELFTNTLCLSSEDYPTEAIVQTIRRNKAAAAALLADYRDPAEGVIDGVTAAQEAKYNEKHYLVSNRRGDTANRDFAGAGEAGFMCPSTVKYARPQRARATSGQWKYIVNTGEHTQTLRLEKCLKPKEPCTYLTDNFKSKCVQVYNYHRLLTWDQQNGLHMDIFKVPTCCSCHIEGYSVSFPPLGHRLQESSSEQFPGEDLNSEQGNHAFENVQSSILKPKLKAPPFAHKQPLEPYSQFADNKKPLDTYSPFTDSQNLISGSPFSKNNDNDDSASSQPTDSYGNSYFPDSFNQASSIRNVQRAPASRNPTSQNYDEVTLPSFLEPPTPAASAPFNFHNKESQSKYKVPGSQFKRTQRPLHSSRRPIRKKISGGIEDLASSGSHAIELYPNKNSEESEEHDYEEASIAPSSPKSRITIAPKLLSLGAEKKEAQNMKDTNNKDKYVFDEKKVNYNYHPIIDFFDEDKERVQSDESIDREDSEPSYLPPVETEWKPMDHPSSRSSNGRHKET